LESKRMIGQTVSHYSAFRIPPQSGIQERDKILDPAFGGIELSTIHDPWIVDNVRRSTP
jgi:hypothetical protein